MNVNDIIEGVGFIDERYIDHAISLKRARRHYLKPIISIAAALMIMIGTLPAATALGSDNAYNLLYSIYPNGAQSFKPIRESCTDNGITLNVISADISGADAKVFFSVTDNEGGRLDDMIDLFDSYYLNTPFDTSNTCRLVSFDKESSCAYFVTETSSMHGESLSGKKLTFGFSTILCGEKHFADKLPISLSGMSTSPKTRKGLPNYSGGSYVGEMPGVCDMSFLETSDKVIFEPIDGAQITAVGFVDGALHVQTRYLDKADLDTHGFVTLKDSSGHEYENAGAFTACFEESGISYEETVIPIEFAALGDYSLFGEFEKSSRRIDGRWQVTARL